MNLNRTVLAAAAAIALSASAITAHAVPLIGLTSANQITSFDSANASVATSVTITGLFSATDRLIGIDLRPFDNRIYGVSLSNRVYTINPTTGVATFVSSLGLTSSGAPVIAPTLAYGIDFNPMADFPGVTATSLRVVGSNGGNYAINVNSGAVTTATSVTGTFTGVAYTNSNPFPTSAPTTALYYIDTATDTLAFTATNFNAPTITTVGSLGVDVLRATGFDIVNGVAYAALLTDDGSADSSIYTINLTTGAATLVSNYTGTLTGLTAAPVPEPGTYALLAAGLVGVAFAARRRRQA